MNKTIIPIIIIVLIVGAFLIVNSLSKVSPQVIENALSKINEYDSYNAEGELGVKIISQEEDQIDVDLSFTQKVDQSNKEEVKSLSDFNLSIGSEGATLQAEFQTITISQDTYLKIIEAPLIPMLMGLNLESLENQWYKINQEEIYGTIENGEETTEGKNIVEEIKKIIKGKNFFKVKKNLGIEELNGQETTCYLLELDKKTIKETIPEFIDVLEKYISEEKRQEYEEEISKKLEEVSQKFDDFWKRVEPMEIKMWIDNSTRIRKVSFEKELNLIEDSQIKKINILFETTFSQFNEKFDIETPDDYKNIEEAVSSLVPISLE